jgi:hypothetical protein
MEQVPNLLFHDEKLKDPSNVANASNNVFIIITQKLNIQLTETGDAISILNDSFPGNFPGIEIILITEAEIKRIMHNRTPKQSCQAMVTSTILQTSASLISHPLSYIYNNHLLYTGIFPGCLKIAEVKTTLHKSCMTNYRPMSLVTVFF